MTEKQYNILLDLYHEFNSDFHLISQETKHKFYDILYGRAFFNRDTMKYEV